MKKTYNVRDIMNRAWDIRKAAAAEIGCKVGEVVMGECLRLAWAEAEGVNAEDNALEIVKEWADMADADKVRMMAACVRKAAKNEIGYSTEDHYLQFSEVPAFGCYRPHDFDEFVNETCIRVLSRLADVDKLTATNERRAAQGKRPLRLVSVVYNAARASIAAVYYADSKHGAAYDWQIEDGEGNAASYLETCCGDATENTETAAIIRADVERVRNGLDEIGKQILEMVAAGKTEREIRKAVGISNVAVHKRIVKMRAALENLRIA
jgi:DNA-directed RNA polymerase specialized sigma24 family protein